MGLQCGIVGLPNVGKSTLFNCLSNARAQAANFPFCTIEPNLGVITVPDERLTELARLVNPEKVVPSTIEIVDIAGLVQGASKGEGLGNKFLGNIRETDAIIHVLRCFDDDNVVHVHGRVDPLGDKEIIDLELQIKDLESVDKKIQKMERAAHAGDKAAKASYEILMEYKRHLEGGMSARTMPNEPHYQDAVRDLFLLTAKPVLYVCNVQATEIRSENRHVASVRALAEQEGASVLVISAAAEAEIAELEDPADRELFLEDLGLTQSGVQQLIRASYGLLNLQTFFTAGEKEVRAWTINKGTLAPQAAGVIHTDFEKGFIRAEVIHYADFVALGSWSACRDAGKAGVEGKTYEVQDGDIMLFRFNV